MTEEVLIELMSDPPPQGSLNLSPLGKTLVVALLNEEIYEKDKEAGRHLVPVQASSTVTAAYWYMPVVKLSIESTVNLKIRGEQQDIRLNDLFSSDVATEQEIPYWTGCKNDEDLVNNFTPNAIVDRMQPVKNKDKNEQLGILARLRVAIGAYEDLIAKLRDGWAWDGENLQKKEEKINGTRNLLNTEKKRLEEQLQAVRQKLKAALETYEITIEEKVISIKNQALDRDLYDLMGEDLPEQTVQQYGKFLELKRHYDRLLDPPAPLCGLPDSPNPSSYISPSASSTQNMPSPSPSPSPSLGDTMDTLSSTGDIADTSSSTDDNPGPQESGTNKSKKR